jgi:hypothetical protein
LNRTSEFYGINTVGFKLSQQGFKQVSFLYISLQHFGSPTNVHMYKCFSFHCLMDVVDNTSRDTSQCIFLDCFYWETFIRDITC